MQSGTQMLKGVRGRPRGAVLAGLAIVLLLAVAIGTTTTAQAWGGPSPWGLGRTATPIKHVVVLFDENESFDHYFGTYPYATNTDGTPFHAKPGTPQVNGLTPQLLTANPNLYNPQRLTPSEALTCDQNHSYTPEQKAEDNGKADQFVQNTESDTCTGQPVLFGQPGLVMDYYDGNTVTGLWNLAQNYAMSDNYYDTTYGPSSPGALHLIAGTTYGAAALNPQTLQPTTTGATTLVDPNAQGQGTLIGDADPAYDRCSDSNETTTSPVVSMSGENVGNLLDNDHITWGWFQGGFAPSGGSGANIQCSSEHENIGGVEVNDYVPHHEPFQFYKSTSNPDHLAPSSDRMIGSQDQANHQYDLSDFDIALQQHNLPAVSFLKPAAYENGHPGNSDPLDEQRFIANTVDEIESSPEWSSTAIVITYDDSDGWYDHVAPPVIDGSDVSGADTAMCTAVAAIGGQEGRCGEGPRLPLLVISPFSRVNYVARNNTNQASVLRFIENNWQLGRLGDYSSDATAGSIDDMFNFFGGPPAPRIQLDATTGAVTSIRPGR